MAISFPTLDIVAADNGVEIEKALANINKFHWLVFISANAVTMLNYYLDGGKMPELKSVHFAAIGQATAQALVKVGLPVDLVPEQGYNSEALLAMPQLHHINGQNFLIVRGNGGREELATTLLGRGAKVAYLDVYKRIIPSIDHSPVIDLLKQNKLDVITITSGDALKNLLIMLGKEHHNLLFSIPLVVISNRIRQIAADMGFKRLAVTNNPSDAAILETVNNVCNGGIEWPN
ncbi:MAG: uroporphyrinogen-III synthase [Methylococcaceae bacterium]